jgi:hypothetical protein
MARDKKLLHPWQLPDIDQGLDAHVMVRVTLQTKEMIIAKAKAAGVAPATWARIQILRGLMRKEK